MIKKQSVSIIIPTLNEAANVAELCKRMSRTLLTCTEKYELIFVDDHSVDSTYKTLQKLARTMPVRVYKKQGQKGKGFSILEGIGYAKYDVVAMIDADLQYPPEALKKMIQKLSNKKVGMVIAERHDNEAGTIRKIGTPIMNVVFKLLFGLGVDVQSGLKLFYKDIAQTIQPKDIGPWTLDLALIQSAKNLGYKTASVDIQFEKRRSGDSKIHFLRDGFAIFWHAFKLRIRTLPDIYRVLIRKPWVKQVLYFVAIGFLNTAIDIVLYIALTRLSPFFDSHVVLAKAITYGVAALNSFILNRRYTFKGSDTTLYALFPYIVVSLCGAGINSLVLSVLLNRIGLNEVISLCIATFFAFAWNFTVSKTIVFKPRISKKTRLEFEALAQIE